LTELSDAAALGMAAALILLICPLPPRTRPHPPRQLRAIRRQERRLAHRADNTSFEEQAGQAM
jgi:hypothetical protein